MIGRGHVTCSAAILLLCAACHAHQSSTTPGGGCRALAQTAGRFVDRAPPAEREETLRFAVEVIDLCQAPGLPPATRKCVASATSPEDARLCAALPLVPLHAAAPARTHRVDSDDGDEPVFTIDDDSIDP
jgi:hypothetical protein